jgi:tocopherol cyclase
MPGMMLPNLPLPHGGYHWDGITPHFFEGWYFRVGRDFAFMYSVQDPLGNQPHSGGAVQILGVGDKYILRTFPHLGQFWANRADLSLLHWGRKSANLYPQILSPESFSQYIQEGYQITPTLHQGRVKDPRNGEVCQWYYQIQPLYSWGNPQKLAKATGDWLSYLPIFDPGWQVLIANGVASGQITWQGETYSLTNVPIYGEKNWGKSFPKKWFWINCNHFYDDLTVTAVGALRETLGVTESVGLIGIHYQNQFLQFTVFNASLSWQVMPWGKWEILAKNAKFRVKITGKTDRIATEVLVPTSRGLQFSCLDTTRGYVQLQLWDARGRLILNQESDWAGLEIGGTDWNHPWVFG